MNKEKEKQMIYRELVELTKASEPNDYFSKYTILDSMGESMANSFIPKDNLPRKSTLSSNLEELVEERKVKTIIGNATRGCIDGRAYTFYRAIEYKPHL